VIAREALQDFFLPHLRGLFFQVEKAAGRSCEQLGSESEYGKESFERYHNPANLLPISADAGKSVYDPSY
jgi:hypothetical protein